MDSQELTIPPKSAKSIGHSTGLSKCQAPKAWYDRINKGLHEQGLTRSESDPNLYYLKNDGKLTILLLYVDDLLITGDDQPEIERLQKKLQQEFDMTDLGEASQYLDVEIHRQPNGIFIS